MRIFYFVAVVFCIISCENNAVSPSSQHLSSTDPKDLLTLLNSSENEQERLELYWQLYKYWRLTSYSDSSKLYLAQLLQLATETESFYYLGKYHNGKGLDQKQEGDLIGAVDHMLMAIENFSKIKAYASIANNLNNLGTVFLQVNDYDYAADFFLKAEEYYDVEAKDLQRIVVNMNLGICFIKKENPDLPQAEAYLEKALEINNKNTAKQDYYYNRIYNLLGFLHFENEEFDSAVKFYELSMQYITSADNNRQKEMIALMNIGEALASSNKPKLAEQYLSRALDLTDQHMPPTNEIIECHNIMAKIKQQQGEHKEAIKLLEFVIDQIDMGLVSNSLQEALITLYASYKTVSEQGETIGDSWLLRVLELKTTQDLLLNSFNNSLQGKGINEILRTKIELHKLETELAHVESLYMVTERQFFVASSATIILVLVLISIWKYYRPAETKRTIEMSDRILRGDSKI